MNDFTIVDKSEKVNENFGLEKFYITKKDIDALFEGKKLYSDFNEGEYALTIELEESEDE